MEQNTIHILIADDHKLFRDGIKALLGKYPDMTVVGEAADGNQLVNLAREKKPDVILADLTMPGTSGLEAIPLIRQEFPEVRIIMLTMHEEGNYIVKSLESGANGYLMKNVDEEELIKAIRTVYAGEKYFNQQVSALMIDTLSKGRDEEVHLTAREKEILKLVADGLSTKMIADKLFLSSRTVETHRVNIMKKVNAQNTAELIKKAYDLLLI